MNILTFIFYAANYLNSSLVLFNSLSETGTELKKKFGVNTVEQNEKRKFTGFV